MEMRKTVQWLSSGLAMAHLSEQCCDTAQCCCYFVVFFFHYNFAPAFCSTTAHTSHTCTLHIAQWQRRRCVYVRRHVACIALQYKNSTIFSLLLLALSICCWPLTREFTHHTGTRAILSVCVARLRLHAVPLTCVMHLRHLRE